MKKILIIEGSIQTGKNFERLLELYNFNVFNAKNEKEVIEILNVATIDVIIIEPLLPYMFLTDEKKVIKNSKYIGAGLYILEKIDKLIQNFKKIPKIIILTLVDFQTLVEEGLPVSKMTQYSYKRKPTKIEELLEEINKN